MKTLECYLLDAEHRGVTDHALSVHRGPHGEVRISIRPQRLAGEELVCEVRGDHVAAPLPALEASSIGELVEGPALATRGDIEALRRTIIEVAAASVGLPARPADTFAEKVAEVRERVGEIRESIRSGARPTGTRFKP